MAIIVGYLATVEGHEALRVAAEAALDRKTSLLVVAAPRPDRDTSEQVDARERSIADLRAQMDAAGLGFDVRNVADSRDIADDLVQAAEDTSADLLVIGLRRRSPVGKLILGTNAQRILLDAPCPVLAVKPSRA